MASRSSSAENLALDQGNVSANDLSTPAPASPTVAVGELMEILPIKRYESFEYTLNGSFTIPLAGTYVLLFDNTFSFGTSKHLFYNAYLSPDALPSPSATPQLLSNSQFESICAAGWLSKRGTGVMKAWSRRWFQLDSSGVLSYYYDRASPLRGSIFVPDCSLIIAKNSLRFSLDSGTEIFHLRAMKEDDFNFWIQVFNSFRHFGPPTTISSSHKLPKLGDMLTEAEREMMSALQVAKQKLELAKSRQEGEIDIQALEAALEALDSLFNVLSKAATEALPAPRTPGEEADEFGEEIFYDVQEIYVDEIDDGLDRRMTASPTVDEEHFAEAIDMAEEEFKTFISQPVVLEPGRALVNWVLTADISVLERLNAPLYRTKMPFPAPPITISLASVMMRKSFPAELNEPVNLLQRLAEELEYAELLDEAHKLASHPLEQMLYVTAFAISGYASSVHRAERKPYNPLLGETFEYIRPDKGFRFIAEKVSHNPVIVACHAESKHWRFWQDVQAETKFMGKSMLIVPKGRINLEFLDDHGQVIAHYSWNKVCGSLRNIFSSNKSVENHGELLIRNELNKDEARITFKESGLFSNSGNEVHGGVYSTSSGRPKISVRGRWDDMLCREVANPSNEKEPLLQVLWKTNPMPSNYEKFFHLPYFAITLNDLPDLLRRCLPPNDSRHRPDQRMLESGMVDLADAEKQRLEQVQRDLRQEREDYGKDWQPLWFKYDAKTRSWIYNGQYWQARSSNFEQISFPKLW